MEEITQQRMPDATADYTLSIRTAADGGLSYDESVTNDIEKDKTRLYIGALVLEALVLTVLWLVGRYFRVV